MDLGTLDKMLYSCITSNIDTDKIIITDEQIEHIANHHPDSYDEIMTELRAAITTPDYILKDTRHDDTGLIIKEISTENKHLLIVLRICINSNDGLLANSIISGWKISESRLQNYLRHKQILYKRE